LPEIGEIVTDVQVRSIVDVTLRSGQPSRRWGCQFVNLPANMQVLLQRYIIRLERERRARMIEE
jgi:c-di-GMP-binding flagellar brake protein YcgR